MLTFGLDPSLTGFGWVLHDSTAYGPARLVARGVVTTNTSTLFVKRYMSLKETLRSIVRKYPEVQTIGSESPLYGESWSEGAYGLYLCVVEVAFTERKDIVFFDPSTVKSLAKMDPTIRKGSMDKQDMIEAAKTDTGVSKWNHNEADAYVVARSAARFWEYLDGFLKEDELTPAEHNTFLKRHVFTKGPKKGREEVRGLVFREGDRFWRFSKLSPEELKVESLLPNEDPPCPPRRKPKRMEPLP